MKENEVKEEKKGVDVKEEENQREVIEQVEEGEMLMFRRVLSTQQSKKEEQKREHLSL